jgi:hypothetical protein
VVLSLHYRKTEKYMTQDELDTKSRALQVRKPPPPYSFHTVLLKVESYNRYYTETRRSRSCTEKAAELAQKLGQLQPFIAVLPQ